MLNKLILANLTHRPVRTLLSVLAIAVEVTMILTLVGVSQGTLDSSKERARGVGADVIVRPPGSSIISALSSAPLSEKFIPLLEKEPHVVLATGTVLQSIGGFDSITGLDFAAFKKMNGGFSYLSGGDPINDDDMIVDEYYARQNQLTVGSRKRLVDHDWVVSGIYSGGKLARVCVKLPVLQEIAGQSGAPDSDLCEAGQSKVRAAGGGRSEGEAAQRPDYTMDALIRCTRSTTSAC